MTVVTFEEYTPSPRYDGIAWHYVIIEEAPAASGPWTLIDTINLSPLDTDPKEPATRSFTTDNATLTNGWYRVTFGESVSGTGQPTQPVYNGPKLEYEPTVDMVARKILSRTRDKYGKMLNTFNSETMPEGDQVQAVISDVITEVADKIGDDIPDILIDDAQNVVALRAAMQIELDYYPDQVNTNRSTYNQLKDLYEQSLTALSTEINTITSDGPVVATGPATRPSYSFPEPGIGFRTRW